MMRLIEKILKNVKRKDLDALGVLRRGKEQPVTLIAGGYPCQGESVAGKRGGKADDRWLWPEMLRLVRAVRPTWVVGENVTGHISLGLPSVLSDLESAGYTAVPIVIPACSAGAPHKRERVFIVAHADSQRKPQLSRRVREGRNRIADRSQALADSKEQPKRESAKEENAITGVRETWQKSSGRSSDMADTKGIRMEGVRAEGQQKPEIPLEKALSRWDGAGEGAGGKQWASEPDVGRVVNGLSSRVDRYIHRRRLEALGNAIVPQQIYLIFKTIALIEGESCLT